MKNDEISEKEATAEKLSARAERCVKLLKGFAIGELVLIGVLALFLLVLFLVARCSDGRDLLVVCTTVGSVGCLGILACMVAALIAVATLFLVAKVNLDRLKSLDKEAK